MKELEEVLTRLLKNAIAGEAGCEKKRNDIELVELAKQHGVLPLLYGQMDSDAVTQSVKVSVFQYYRLLHDTLYYVDVLNANGIKVVPLKGAMTARWYVIPELRKSGDIDLLLANPGQLEDAKNTFLDLGLQLAENQHANYHVGFETADGIEIELHQRMIETLEDAKVNERIDQLQIEACANTMTVHFNGKDMEVFTPEYEALTLLLHMLHHFLRSGFGLKLLCDWTVFWNQNQTEVFDAYKKHVLDLGLGGFADMVSGICTQYFGMREIPAITDWRILPNHLELQQHFFEEIMRNDEFGLGQQESMVKLSQGSLRGYTKEFHHQMHINFPKVGNCFLLWPVLWIWTLLRFLRNNRVVRNTTLRKVIKATNEKSKYMRYLDLFKTK